MNIQETATTSAIAFDPTAYGAEVGNYKRLCVAAHNGATPFSRTTFAGLLSGKATVSTVTTLVLAAFGNPKSPKGKPVEKFSSSSADHVEGFGAARKTVQTIFDIWENVEIVAGLRELLAAFAMEREGAPKSLAALKASATALVTAHNEAAAKAAADAAGDEPKGDEPKGDEPKGDAPTVTVASMATDLLAALRSATDADLVASAAQLAELQSVIETALAVIAPAPELAEAA